MIIPKNFGLGGFRDGVPSRRCILAKQPMAYIETVRVSLSEEDKAFWLSINRLTPDWPIYNYQSFPSVEWKPLNLEKCKKGGADVYEQQLTELESIQEQ